MAWATVVTVVSGSPYERKIARHLFHLDLRDLEGLPFLSRVFRVIVLGIRPGCEIAAETHRDRLGGDLGTDRP
jgi:hypothetical protein